MLKVNIAEAKISLSQYLAKLKPGDRLVICKRNVPIAELRRLPDEHPERPRPWGLDKGRFSIPKDFNAPLSDSEIALWYSGVTSDTTR